MQVAANITCYVHPGSRAKATQPWRLTRHVAESIAKVEQEAEARGGDPRDAVLRMAHDEYDDWKDENQHELEDYLNREEEELVGRGKPTGETG